jgi:hypothetical protein
MENLQKQFIAVAKEYARQFSQVIGYDLEFWTGLSDGHSACFGDNYFFTLEEMCLVVDNLSRWQESYTDVGKEVLAWFNYFSDIDHYIERNPSGHPTINLWSWLKGCRPSLQQSQ